MPPRVQAFSIPQGTDLHPLPTLDPPEGRGTRAPTSTEGGRTHRSQGTLGQAVREGRPLDNAAEDAANITTEQSSESSARVTRILQAIAFRDQNIEAHDIEEYVSSDAAYSDLKLHWYMKRSKSTLESVRMDMLCSPALIIHVCSLLSCLLIGESRGL